jgi:Ca2+/Na+ antiporter
MSINRKLFAILIGIGIVLVVGVSFIVKLTLIVAAIALAAIFVLAFLISYAFKEKREDEKIRAEEERQRANAELVAKASEKVNALLGGLADLLLKMKIAALAQEVIARTEEIVDKLMVLLPELNSKYAGIDFTFTVNQMSSRYLSKLINGYIVLSPEGREAHKGEMLDSLDALLKEVDQIAKIVEDQNLDAFDTRTTFIKRKFLSDSLEA